MRKLILLLCLCIFSSGLAQASEIRWCDHSEIDANAYSLQYSETDFWFESGDFTAAGNGPIEFFGVKTHDNGAFMKVAVGSMAGKSRGGNVWGGFGVSGAF